MAFLSALLSLRMYVGYNLVLLLLIGFFTIQVELGILIFCDSLSWMTDIS